MHPSTCSTRFHAAHVTRIAGSFAIVVIAYWAYALLAVPWIEPPVDLPQP